MFPAPRPRALWVRLAFLALLVVGSLLLLGRRVPPVAAATKAPLARPTPGELTILDTHGKEAGLCPLKHTDVQADVAGYVAHVAVTQEFSNPSREPIEAVYTFPLPNDAAVDDMTMTVGSRVVQGEIKRKEEAREIYEAAKSEGKAAALLDQERPNIFTQNVANIMPGDSVKITIKYVNVLKYDDGRYEWSFPLVVGPRYTPSGGYTVPGRRGAPSAPLAPKNGGGGEETSPTAVVTDADKITPAITPPGTRAGHDISIHVHLEAGLPITGLTSVLHPISTRANGPTGADVTLQNGNEIPNKDFILRWTAAGSEMQSGMLTYAPGPAQVASLTATPSIGPRGAGGGYFTLVLQPPLAPARSQVSPKEMVFVIDQTGSQQGWPIEKAKETMRHCIQSLNPGDTFQLLGFNTDVFPCFPQAVPANPQTVKQALDYLAPLQGAGGTDILKAADYALKMPADPNRLRIVCFMTDGYVGDDMQVIDYVKKHRGEARMFPFGVGDSVNRFLIDGMAREGRGAAEYVTLDEQGKEASDRFYKRVADPILLDPQVDWHGLPVEETFPQHIPDVFSQGPVIIKGRYRQAAEGDVTVRGLLHGQPWQQTIHVVFPAAKADGSAIATLWAREKIEDLQNEDWMGAQTGHPDAAIKEQIVRTALDYRLMSQWTSFVAVEQRVVNIGGRQRTIDVPVEMPEGVSYSGIFGAEGSSFQDANGTQTGRTLFLNRAASKSSPAGGFAGGGGFGGGGFAGPAVALAVPAAAPPSVTAMPAPARRRVNTTFDMSARDEAVSAAPEDREITLGSPAGQKWLEAMKPAERRALLRQAKLAPSLQGPAQGKPTLGQNAPTVTNGRVDVQVWLNALPPDGLAKLKALGFDLSATLTPGKLLLGSVPVAKLDALLALPWVRRVEPPRFK